MNAEPLPAHLAASRDRAKSGARLVLGGAGLSGALALLKFTGGILGHSYALIADGTDSLIDVLSSVLVWAGFRVAARPPDAEHPYGHGRAETLAGLAGAGFIFVTIGVVAWHAVRVIVAPQRGPNWLTLPLLAGIVVLKIWFSRRLGSEQRVGGSTAIGFEAWHHASDALTSGAALVGIGIAVIGGAGWESADGWAAIFACIVVAFNGVGIVKKSLGEMMDEVAPAEVENRVRTIAGGIPGVLALDKCRVRKSGINHLVDIHVQVDGDLSVRDGHAIAHAVKDALLSSTLRVTDVSVHVEPRR